MQSGLTKKDKILLVFLINVVICFLLGYLVIYPNLRMAFKYAEKAIIQESRKEVNDSKISNLPVMLADKESYEEEVAANSSDFYDVMNSSEIDKMMTGMALDYGLDAYDLVIDISTEPAQTEAYIYSERGQGQTEEYTEEETDETSDLLSLGAGDEAEAITDTSSETGDKYEKRFREDFSERYGYAYGTDPMLVSALNSEDPFAQFDDEPEETDASELSDMVGSHAIYQADVSMRLGGNHDDINRFLQSLFKTDKELLVTSYQWSEEMVVVPLAMNVDGDAGYEANTRKILDLSFSMFMCDK